MPGKTILETINTAAERRSERLKSPVDGPLDVYSLMATTGVPAGIHPSDQLFGLPSPPLKTVTSDELLKEQKKTRYATTAIMFNMSEDLDRLEYQKLSSKLWNSNDNYAHIDTNSSWDKFGNLHVFIEYVEIFEED